MLSRQSNFIQKPLRHYKRRMPPMKSLLHKQMSKKMVRIEPGEGEKKRGKRHSHNLLIHQEESPEYLSAAGQYASWTMAYKLICMSFLSILKQAKQWFPGKVTNPSPPLLHFTELGTETSVPLYRIWCTEHHAYALGQHQAVLYLSWWGCRSIAPCKINFTQIKQIY